MKIKQDKVKAGNYTRSLSILTISLTLLVLLLSVSSSNEARYDRKIERKIEKLLAQMTLDEKIGQMTQVRHFADITDEDIASKFIGSVIHTDGPAPGEDAAGWQQRFIELQKQALSTRLGIPLLFGVDAVHGQNTFDGAVIFPHNIGLGATRNLQLVEEVAAITALEVRATGINWAFSPCIAIPYNEKWGRVYEAFSENTELTTKMAKAAVIGLQGDLRNPTKVLATAKHYVGDGATDFGIEGGNTSLSMHEVSERLLPPYREAVKHGVGSVMVSFNAYNGISMHAHKELITDSLKNGMGFSGIVLTDWKGYSRFGKSDIINAGVDMVMAVDGDLDLFQQDIKANIASGHVKMERIDDAVRRILRQKFRLGLFENPFPDSTLIGKIGAEEHRDIARQAVRESLVLLKRNEGILPIQKTTNKIVVVGEHADNSSLQSGGWTIRWQGNYSGWRDQPISYSGATTILDGIKQKALQQVVYDTTAKTPQLDADVAIIVVGETPYAELFGDIGDGKGTYKLTLSDEHKRYIESYAGKGPEVIVVLISGRPLVVTEQINQSDAFIAAWLPGSEGDGIAEVLFGEYNFSGTLPHSWPKSENDFKGKFGPNYWDTTITPLFEYGYGLKY
ncbi:MAG: glycoside hydrolase family 3 C-terminal domain-containing protein [Bacteroidota bacterium]|nr:MAG: glycoside hydrolase family 3 C-terminal domain-containing protein [Bacteroidota bacterium]